MKHTFFSILFSIVPLFVHGEIFNPPVIMYANEPVIEVRAKPVERTNFINKKPDTLSMTQLEKGEPVEVHQRLQDWYKIECLQQPKYINGNWTGYPGWVKANSLTSDTHVKKIFEKIDLPQNEIRKKILENAAVNLGTYYLWGGRTRHDPSITDVLTGFDCSGTVYWSYLQVGIIVPRDAVDQWRIGTPIEPPQLKPADIILIAPKNTPTKVYHVVLYKEDNMLLEAPQTGAKVREITFEKRFGIPLDKAANGQVVGERVIYFRTLIR
jgi:cell wall-associated NlpC family hydrolase